MKNMKKSFCEKRTEGGLGVKIAVLSDTHVLLRPEVKTIIAECDAVLHAGDINSQKIIDEIEMAAKPNVPLYAVRGNNDKEWAEKLPHYEAFSMAVLNIEGETWQIERIDIPHEMTSGEKQGKRQTVK